jgi:ketosteroid isomerase-like protein
MEDVKAANLAYYSALSARDLSAMARLWDQSAEAVNIAPPTRPVAHVGWPAIRKNYEQFWATLRRLTVTMDEASIAVRGDVAWVYGIEQTKRIAIDGTESGGRNYGTSIFIRRDGQWLMTFHQAAPVPTV